MSLFDVFFGNGADYRTCQPQTFYHTIDLTPRTEIEKRDMEKTMELLKGCSPFTNIIPTLDLVRKAREMGYDLVKLPAPYAPDAMGRKEHE